MSKWLDNSKFDEFKKDRKDDKEASTGNTDFALKWKNPKMGEYNKPREYIIRLLPDLKGNFYKKFYYHMFQSGDNWIFIMCPKTHGLDEYCPWCQANKLLYQGSASDKKRAYTYKRGEKFVGNIFIKKDPRDLDEQDEDKRVDGKTRLYEFPGVVEAMIKKEITDEENGWGASIFDPEAGHDLILRIAAKKADKNGKVWPDYTPSIFAKKESAIASSAQEIDDLMDTTQDIKEYLDNSMLDVDKHKELLKAEMLWEDVEDQFHRYMGASTSESETKEETHQEEARTEAKEGKSEQSSDPDPLPDDPTDEELLSELDNM